MKVSTPRQNPYSSNILVKCYCCGVEGNKSKAFPTLMMISFVNVIEDEDGIPIESNKEYEEHFIDGEKSETHSLMACKLAYNKPKKQEHPQRHSILHMRCTINDKIYITL